MALASSTDNFMVGLSVGLSRKHLGLNANLLISFCNATGAGVAGYLGGSLQQVLPIYLVPLLAAVAFGVLSVQEFVSFHHNNCLSNKTKDENNCQHTERSHESVQQQHLDTPRAIQLALPMTLNNLAGGVAGGAVGVSSLQASLYGLMASFWTMLLGYKLGRTFAASKEPTIHRLTRLSGWRERLWMLLDPSFVSASLLGILCFMSIQEAWDAALM